MIENVQVLESLMNILSRGLVYVDLDKRIQTYNQKAKEITGIDFDHSNTHESGRIVDGDIVIIADNDMGDDDGDLSITDLELINIHDKKIQPRDMLLCVGVYNNNKIDPSYKYLREHQLGSHFVLDTNYLGFHIVATIDPIEKRITISINGHSFHLNYFNSISNMVVIDGTNGHIKFFQMQGYSVRKEAPGNLVRGGSFLAKTSSYEEIFPLIGSKLLDIFEENELTRKVFELLEGKQYHIKDAFYEINRRPIICSIIPSQNKEDSTKIEGVYLMIQDATELEVLLDDRNRIIEGIEKKHQGHTLYHKDFPKDAFKEFVGSGPIIQDVKYLAYKASQTKFNVIITGESGTGKSQLAREIHKLQNIKGPFVVVNCNAITPTLFESELFGYVGGSFTGANSAGKMGYFETANGGTIFLDEIGEISLNTQVKLLYVLQNKTIYRVGSSKPVQVNVRVIVASNKNLEEEVTKGTFRRDLFYRINVFPIYIPPVRERKSDLYLLINHILQKACERYEVPLKQLSGEALRKMFTYSWPGNVRELENIIERAITLCESSLIYPEHISITNNSISKTMKELLQEEEIHILQKTLIRYKGDKKMVMEELDISKSAFYDKYKKYGL
ncbi:MAG: transcriptional regulator with PAS, ATPase and Fis domain [Clostridium sp.]|jgi:transcriptional regulator with PAS, ATPase and Fis domain